MRTWTEIDYLVKPLPPKFRVIHYHRSDIFLGQAVTQLVLFSSHSDLFLIYSAKTQKHQERDLWMDFLTRTIRK